MSETKTLKLTFVNTADRGISQTLIEDILQKYLPCNIVVATEGNPAPILKTNDLLIETVTVTTEVIDSKTDGSGSGSGSAVEVAGSSGGADRSATATPIQSQIQILEQELRDKNKLISELEYTNTKSLASIQAFHKQQKNLFDEFVLLRTKYDEVKHSLVVILWKYCALCHPDLREIPRQQVTIEDGGQFVENADQIGDYRVGDLLGEGQFASVRLCWKLRPGAGVQVASGGDDELQRDLALKIMNKDRIVSFTMLKRVSNELYALRILSSPYVVRLVDVLHGENKLYIITEKGGESDLFEFFDAHPEGVVESWAMSILYYIMKALLFVHSKGICHRDLKPENILVAFNSELGICTDLKLCDFGLSTTFSTTTMLTDFCGSPGFFAPEMIIKSKSAMAMAAAGGLDGSIHNHNSSTGGGGSGGLKSPGYYGDKADIWSVGCVLLELMLGHELFCELWMSAYDYENIQNKIKFQDAISCSVSALGDELDRLNEDQQAATTETDGASAPPAFSPSLVQYILDILNLDDIARPTAYAITQSNWCCHLFQQEKQEKEQKDKEIAEKLAAVSLGMPKGVGRIDGGKKSTASSGAGSGSGSGGRKSRHRSMGGQTSEDEYLKAAAASSSKANRSASDDVVSSSTPPPGASTVAADSGAAGGGTEVTTTATATTTEDNLAETAAVESNESSASTNETASASAGGNAFLPAEDLDTVMPLKSDLASHHHDFRVTGKDDAAAADDDDGDVGRDFTTIRYTHSRDSMEPHRARERHETATTEDLADTLFHLEGDDAAKQDAIKSVEAAKVLAHEQLDPQARPQISQKERKLYSEHAQQTHHSIKLPPAVIREDENSNSSGISLGENGELLDLRGQRQGQRQGQTDRQLSFNDDSIVGTTTATATASAAAVMASPPSVKGGGAMGRTEPIYHTPQHPSHSTARSAALASQTAPPNINSNSNADASASTNANANAAVFTSASVGAVIGTGASTGTSTSTGTGTGNAVVSAVSPDAHGDTLSSLSVGVPALDPQQRFGPIRGGASIPSLLLETPGQTPGPTPGGSEGNSPVVLHLPPVISSTPSVYKAKKILKKGDVLAHQAEMGDWRTPMGSPGGTSRLMMSKENSRTGDELMSEEQQNYEALSRHSNYHHQQHHNNNHHQHQHTAAAIAHGLTGDSTAVTTAAIASNNTNNTNSSSDSNTAAAATGAGLDHGGDGGDKTE